MENRRDFYQEATLKALPDLAVTGAILTALEEKTQVQIDLLRNFKGEPTDTKKLDEANQKLANACKKALPYYQETADEIIKENPIRTGDDAPKAASLEEGYFSALNDGERAAKLLKGINPGIIEDKFILVIKKCAQALKGNCDDANISQFVQDHNLKAKLYTEGLTKITANQEVLHELIFCHPGLALRGDMDKEYKENLMDLQCKVDSFSKYGFERLIK